MFDNLKTTIKQLAAKAVEIAEETLGSNKGQEKKKMAIEFVISKLPVISPFKKLIAIFLSDFIDDAVEFAVNYMNSKGEL